MRSACSFKIQNIGELNGISHLWTDGDAVKYGGTGRSAGSIRGTVRPAVARGKGRVYLRAAELGINLFDMGYGDEVYIPDELKGNHGGRYFSLKIGGPPPDRLEEIVEMHLLNLRRDAIDILRLHHLNYVEDEGLAEGVDQLKQAGKVRSVCLIRHCRQDQEAYAEHGPVLSTEADLVIYNYVCRWQEPGIRRSAEAGKAVLIMKALGGQWLAWADQTQEDWSRSTEETIVKLAPAGEKIRPDVRLIYPIVKGPWQELAEPGEDIPPSGVMGAEQPAGD